MDPNAKDCKFSAPSAAAWQAVAVAATDPQLPVPTSSGIFAIVFAAFGSFMVLLRHFVWVGKLDWMRKYHPNMMCIALAFTLPQTFCKCQTSLHRVVNADWNCLDGTAMVMGSMIATIWAKKNFASFELAGYPIAAGLIAGEGIGGVFNAIFQIVGISGDKYGTQIACPVECAG